MNLTIFKHTFKQNLLFPVQLIIGIFVPSILLVAGYTWGLFQNDAVILSWILMSLMWSAFVEGLEILENKQKGVEIRILAGPVTWVNYLCQYLLSGIFLTSIRIIGFLIIGAIFYDWSIGVFMSLFSVYFLFSINMIALAFWWGRMFKTIGSATGTFSFTSTLFTMIGGLWFPVALLPRWLEFVSMATPIYWSVQALYYIVDYGVTASLVLYFLIIFGFATIYMVLGSMKRKVL